MISTLHGTLDLTAIAEDVVLQPGDHHHRRATLCRIRGTALGQPVNMQLVFDLDTGEMMLFSPDGFNGAFRVGDMVVAQTAMQVQKAMAERAAQHAAQDNAQGGAHAPAH